MTEKGAEGILRQAQDDRPLVHYVFKPENTYETEFRGGKALGVRDLGKGEPADLVIPEQFTPYQRVYLGWDPDWMKNRSDWLDLAVNIMGFLPFGLLLLDCGMLAIGKRDRDEPQGVGRVPRSGRDRDQASGFGIKTGIGLRVSGFGMTTVKPVANDQCQEDSRSGGDGCGGGVCGEFCD